MAMLTDVAYKNISHDTETKNGYIVKQNSPANSSGFAATLYQKGDEIVLAIRGTEPGDFYNDVIDADIGGLAADSIPSRQAVDMIEYIEWLLSSNKISKDQKLTIVGHSLGGALAQIASKMYPDLFDKCYTFNSPSGKNLYNTKIYIDGDAYFYKTSKEAEIIYLDKNGGKAIYNYQNSPMTTSVTDIRAKDFIAPIANLYGGERFGELIKVSGETHFITPMTKILYFYDFAISHGISEEFVTNYLSGYYKNIVSSIVSKSIADIAEKIIQDIDKTIGKAIGKSDIIDICQIYDTDKADFTLELIPFNASINQIFPDSNISIEKLYALVNLNNFIISDIDIPVYKELEKYKNEYSDNYIQDKAVMFKKALDGKAAINGIYFKDYESNLDLDTTQDFNGMYDEYHFGTNSNDTIEPIGTKISLDKNRIYALGGDDHIKAPNGSNYIEAGSGNDTISRVFF